MPIVHTGFREYVAPPGTEVAKDTMLGAWICAGIYSDKVKKMFIEFCGKDPMTSDQQWYPLQQVLDTFRASSDRYGPEVVQLVGRRLLSFTPTYQPKLRSVEHALRVLNKLYHILHRKDGVQLWDAARKKLLPGVGDYLISNLTEGSVDVHCTGPYPCVFDAAAVRGLVEAVTYSATLEHAPGGCRRYGSESCTYKLKWIPKKR